MEKSRRWEDVKAEAHQRRPEPADTARRAAASAKLDAYVAGYHPKERRNSLGKTQPEVAAALGVSQSRISRIEPGDVKAMELELTAGAGSAIRIARSFDEVLGAALTRVARCDCGEETSCYGCLRGYRNQPFHEELRRGAAVAFLRRSSLPCRLPTDRNRHRRAHAIADDFCSG